ncbi:hypothetical protein UlMin_015031 [Ulmus minor]
MEPHTETETHPTFQTKQRKTHLKSQMAGLRQTKRASSQRRSRRERDHRSSTEEDEKEQVERKIQCLKSIVPGGESLGVDKLFDQTAAYIMALQCQLKAMKTLASFFESLDKEKSKFGP